MWSTRPKTAPSLRVEYHAFDEADLQPPDPDGLTTSWAERYLSKADAARLGRLRKATPQPPIVARQIRAVTVNDIKRNAEEAADAYTVFRPSNFAHAYSRTPMYQRGRGLGAGPRRAQSRVPFTFSGVANT